MIESNGTIIYFDQADRKTVDFSLGWRVALAKQSVGWGFPIP
jgi:hypothetical protein